MSQRLAITCQRAGRKTHAGEHPRPFNLTKAAAGVPVPDLAVTDFYSKRSPEALAATDWTFVFW
jgi:hypothetical protein